MRINMFECIRPRGKPGKASSGGCQTVGCASEQNYLRWKTLVNRSFMEIILPPRAGALVYMHVCAHKCIQSWIHVYVWCVKADLYRINRLRVAYCGCTTNWKMGESNEKKMEEIQTKMRVKISAERFSMSL